MKKLSRRDFLRRAIEAGLALSLLGSGAQGWRALSAPYPNAKRLVSAPWLAERIEEIFQLRVVDAGGKLKYARQHLPNAVNLWYGDVSTLTMPRTVAPPELLRPFLEEAGLRAAMTVVIYDDEQSRWAGRLFWILEYYGFSDVRLLDGGLEAWAEAGGRLTDAMPSFEASSLDLRADPRRVVTGAWLLDHLVDPNVQIVDARTRREYAIGDASRHMHGEQIGHIPGALLVPVESALEPNGRFKRANELRLLYRAVSPDKTVVTYSENGVRAALAYFQLRLLGYPDVRVYDASWAEWSSDERFPIATGAGATSNAERHTSTCW
jgi:thiosulfate/3-mercaptopyruvate sulfurtransferase